MAYEVRKSPTKQNPGSWKLVWRVYSGKDGKKYNERYIPKKELVSIGFRPEMTIEEARDWARSLNLDEATKKLEARRNRINERLKGESTAALAYLPKSFVQAFEKEDLQQRFRGTMGPHWQAAKRLITEVKMAAHEWFRAPEVLYNYFADKEVSLSYAEKILRVLNLWGEFLFYKTGKPYFPVKAPTGVHRERIADAYFDSNKGTKESAPITPDQLATAKAKLLPEHYNYLFLTVWFGLRPVEVDKLIQGEKAWYVTEQEGHKVFACYQWKLTGIPRDKRWKFIPILFPEQEKAIEIIREGKFRRPLVKTIKLNVNPKATNYGGRKNFEALMRSLGRTFTEAQAWLGHASIERTWRDYRNQLKVFIEKK